MYYNTYLTSCYLIYPIFAIIALTDYYDGVIIRKRTNKASDLLTFRILDSFADKFGLLLAFLGFYLSGVFNPYVLNIIVIRELLIFIIGIVSLKKSNYLNSSFWGKLYYGVLILYCALYFPNNSLSPNAIINFIFIIFTIILFFADMLYHKTNLSKIEG